MGERHIALMEKAREKFSGNNLKLPQSCLALSQCFSEHNGRLMFWFDTEDGSTRVVGE